MLDQELLSLKEFFFFFRLIRHFFSPNFENLPEQAILPKLGFKPFNNGLFQKTNKQGVKGDLNHPTPSVIFHSQKLQKILLSHPLEILSPKTKTPGNSTFFITSGNSTLFLINPWKFLCNFFNIPGNTVTSTPLFVSFWNSPMKESLSSPLSI